MVTPVRAPELSAGPLISSGGTYAPDALLAWAERVRGRPHDLDDEDARAFRQALKNRHRAARTEDREVARIQGEPSEHSGEGRGAFMERHGYARTDGWRFNRVEGGFTWLTRPTHRVRWEVTDPKVLLALREAWMSVWQATGSEAVVSALRRVLETVEPDPLSAAAQRALSTMHDETLPPGAHYAVELVDLLELAKRRTLDAPSAARLRGLLLHAPGVRKREAGGVPAFALGRFAEVLARSDLPAPAVAAAARYYGLRPHGSLQRAKVTADVVRYHLRIARKEGAARARAGTRRS